MTGSKPLTAVLDTNVFVSGLLFQRGNPYAILEAWRAHAFVVAITPPLYAEIADVLKRLVRPGRYQLTNDEVVRTLALLERIAVPVTAPPQVPVTIRDPKDVMVLAAAIGGRADYLVSGDQDLLQLANDERLGNLKIVAPRAFLEFLELERGWRGAP